MTGPEHYRESERLLERADKRGLGDDYARDLVAMAQVHATLAQAAATALNPSGRSDVTLSSRDAWVEWRDLVDPEDCKKTNA